MAGLEDKFKYSRIITQDCKKLNLSVREKAFADLIALGWKDTDAFVLTNLYNPVYSAEVNLKELNRYVLEDASFKEYLSSQMKKTGRLEKSARKKAKEKEQAEADISDEDISTELSKENQLRELIAAKKNCTKGSKEWLDIKKMIADITQVKKSDDLTEDNTIHYYLPLTCNNCSLYMASKKKSGK